VRLNAATFLIVQTFLAAAQPNVAALFRQDLAFLCSPELGGRGTPSAGLNRAAEFSAARLRSYGLRPRIQEVPMLVGAACEKGKVAILAGDGPESCLIPGKDVVVCGFAPDTTLEKCPVAFLGFGIQTRTYDDLAGQDLHGRIAVIGLSADRQGPFKDLSRWAWDVEARVQSLKAAGAAAVVFVTDGNLAEAGRSLGSARDLPIPALLVASRSLPSCLGDLPDRFHRICKDGQPASGPLPVRMSLALNLKKIEATYPNVAALLPGTDPGLKDQIIVMGAHIDHLGEKTRADGSRIYYPGADDNASGAVMVLEMARRLAGKPTRRPILFLHFGGEEMGLQGSSFWVEHPTETLSRVRFMFNCDQVGRLSREVPVLTLDARGSSTSLLADLARLTPKGLTVRVDPGLIQGGTDSICFSGKGIPTVSYFTGEHEDYHQPSDTPDKINLDGMATLAEMLESNIREIADRPTPPEFQPRPDLGMRADGSFETGFHIGLVPKEGAGARLGLQSGDIVTAIGVNPVRNQTDFLLLTRDLRPGDTFHITWIRNGKTQEAETVLAARSN
jgi:hypothetical protein